MRTPRRSIPAVLAVLAAPSLVVAILIALLVVAGCGGVPASATPVQAPPGATSASASASAPPGSAPSASVSVGVPSGVPGPDTAMDPSLLQVLPATVASATVEQEPGSFAEAIRDPSFVASVDAAAFAIVVEGEDLASGVVAHLRPDVFSETFFRDWRDSYDEGACAQAGGVVARAQVGIGNDRTMDVTTCAQGLRVYHAYLAERDVVVSLISLGERRFGEQLMTGLRP